MDKISFRSPTLAAQNLPCGFLICTSLTTLVDYFLMRLSRPRYSSKGSEAANRRSGATATASSWIQCGGTKFLPGGEILGGGHGD